MAGFTNISAGPYPNGPFVVQIGGFLPNGCAAMEVGRFILPFDAIVRSVRLMYKKSTAGSAADLDAVTLSTIDSTAKTVVAAVDGESITSGAKATLHADMAAEPVIKTGDGFTLIASSDGSNKAGFVVAQIELDPAYTRPNQD